MNIFEQLVLQDILALFVCLILFEGFIVLPANYRSALPARYIAHKVLSCRHTALLLIVFYDVVDCVE